MLPIVAVAGGHGLYFNYKYNDWRAQRDPHNGMIEDFVTPYYQRDLAAKLTDEGWATVAKARTNETTLHTPSGQQWWRVSARYWLQKTLPQETGIWNSMPNSSDAMRERDQDIRSRPYHANYVGAAAAINIHTDGDENSPNTRGTRAYFYTGRAEDQQLASNVLCYMKESIRSIGNYSDWSFVDTPFGVTNKGEITFAQVPSIIVEVGFHTNPQDALALQDDIFRSAAVNGMAKGWHLHSQGVGCQPLKITNIPALQVTQNIPANWPVHFEGHPKFPLKVVGTFKTCPAGWTCSQFTKNVYSETTSPINLTWDCTVSGSTNPGVSTFELETFIIDDDNVRTTPFAHTVVCSPPTASSAAAKAGASSAQKSATVSFP